MKSKYLLFVFILIAFRSLSQGIVPVFQSGHSSDIKYYAVNYEKEILLTADENELMLWNLNTGKQLRRIASPFKIRGAVFCSNGEEIAVANYVYKQDASLRIYSSATGELLSTISYAENSWDGLSYKPLDELIYDNKFNRVAVRSFNQINLVDISARKKLAKFNLCSYDAKFCFTDSPDVLAIACQNDNDLVLSLTDTLGTEIRSVKIASDRKQTGLITNQLQDIFYLLDNKAVVHSIDSKLQVGDTIISDSVNTITTYAAPKMCLSKDGTKLLVPLHEKQYLYDLQKKKWLQNNWKWISASTGLLFAGDDADKVVKISGSLPYIIDVNTGNNIFLLSSKTAQNNNIRFSPSGRMMSIFHSSSTSKSTAILDLKTGMQFNAAEISFAIFQWITDSVVLCAQYPKWDEKASDFVHSIEIRNIYTGQVLQELSLLKAGSIDYGVISDDLKKIALVTLKELFVFYGDHFEKKTSYKLPGTSIGRKVYFTPDSKKVIFPTDVIRIYDFSLNKWSQLKDSASYDFRNLSFTPDSKELWYEDYKSIASNTDQRFNMQQAIFVHNFQSGVTNIRRKSDTLIGCVAIHPKEDIYAIGYFNGTIEIRKRSDDQLIYSGKDHNGHVDEITFAPAKSWIISSGEDGLIRFRDYNTKEHIVTSALLYTERDKGYALLSPDNYYLVPASLISELHYVKDYNTYSFAQLDLYLNRPDKVLERIGMADNELLVMNRKAFKRRLNKAGYFNEEVPDISGLQPMKIMNRKQVKNISTDSILTLDLQTAAPASEITSLNLYINGQKVKQLKGTTSRWSVPVELNVGMNNIEVAYVAISGLESLRERIEVKYVPSKPLPSNTYYIGVAVSHYKDSSMNLKYTVKDVTDIALNFRKKDSSARTYLFIDSNVKKTDLAYIKKILESTTVNDKVAISFSGHGMLDTAYNFYFAAWDMDFSSPQSKGISFNDINNLLDNIPARQKLVLIDACHSGEADKDVVNFAADSTTEQSVKAYSRSSIKVKSSGKLQNTVKLMEQYFTDISKANGANIISAAAAEEYALESSEWNNGVFSYSFIQALFDKKADKNYNGRISQTELREYMQQLVLKLTKGKQQPTSRSMNSDFDWEF